MAFDQLVKRHFWAATGLLVGAAAFLDAQGITQLVGLSISPDEKQLAEAPLMARVPAPPASTSDRSISSEPILSRNPFDSVKGALRAPVVEEPDAGPTGAPDTSDPMSAPPCDGVKVLVIAASADPEWSFAVFGGDKKTQMRRRGGEISGKTVTFIGWDRVWLTSGSTLCQAEMFKPAQVAAVAPVAAETPVAPAPPAGGGAGAVPDHIKKGIAKIGPNEYNIDRAVVDKILENQADLMRQARIVPEQENGKTVGIRLFGVRPETLLGTLGMENGDRLEKINGFEMASPEKALEAYARLRTAEKLTIAVNRRGQPVNIDYNIK